MSVTRSTTSQRGFTLIEALIALVVMAVGMLALASMQTVLSRNSDIAKQRTEAMRLAQEKIESLRSYTQLASNGSTGWADLPASSTTASDTIAPGNTYADNTTVIGNTTFYRTWSLGGSSSDGMRAAKVTVSWTDRGATNTDASNMQSVVLSTVISKTDPFYVGSLGFPLPANTNLKRPKNRNLNIPVPAYDLGSGKSGINVGTFSVIFSNDSGYVVQKCSFSLTSSSTAADVANCSLYNAYIIAGYVSRSSTSIGWPTGVNTASLTGVPSGSTISCSYSDAQNQNSSNTTLTDYKYYLCVVPVDSTNGSWSGTFRLGGVSTSSNIIVCRFQYASDGASNSNERNVQPYSTVQESLDNQNYYLTTTSSNSASPSCPTVDALATTLHQDCRSAGNYSGNTSTVLAASCPTAVTN